MQLNGVLTALITPYDENGDLDLDSLRRHAEHLMAAGVNGFFACGTTGEGALLLADEKRRVITAAVRAAGGEIPVIGAVIQPDTCGAVAEVESYSDLGIRFAAVVAPYYIRVDQAELIAHFVAVADASPVPVLAYDIPGNTANPLTDAVYDEILTHENVVGVKDSSGDLSRFSRRVIGQGQSDGRQVAWIMGEDTLDAAALLIGASGIVSGLSNVFPEPFVRMFAAAGAGDIPTVLKLQNVINTLHSIIRKTGKGVSPIRLALSQLGYGSRYLRSRTLTLGTEWDDAIRSDVEAARTLYESL